MPDDCTRDALLRPACRPSFLNRTGVADLGTTRPSISAADAWWMSNASHVAYYQAGELQERLKPAGWEICGQVERGGARVVVLLAPPRDVVVSFRGTDPDEFENLRANVDFRLVPFDVGGRVHRGFQRTLDGIWSDLNPMLQQLVQEGGRLWYTGHSLGGALANLAAARRTPYATYTFGAPRIGDRVFRRLFAGQSLFRVVNCTDLVPTLPQEAFGYRHAGELWFVDRHQNLHRRPSRQFVYGARIRANAVSFRDVNVFEPRSALARTLVDHSIGNYSAALRRAF